MAIGSGTFPELAHGRGEPFDSLGRVGRETSGSWRFGGEHVGAIAGRTSQAATPTMGSPQVSTRPSSSARRIRAA